MKIKTLTVSEVNDYIKRLLISDPILYNIYIEGEISNYKMHSSGHAYFTLKDKDAKISCIIFKSNVDMLKFIPEDGMQVIVRGYISVYEKNGIYQLYVDDMSSAGMGDLYIAFQQLKTTLEKKGYFDPEMKKSIPFIPKRVGIITSPTGAAVKDIISVINRRFPGIELYVFPVLVQGEHAAQSIKNAIELCNNYEKKIDVIILGRGGGSIEELWAFNELIVAEAIFKSDIPIISAVGHETDYTISDFVADVRAHTPSSAGELVVPKVENVLKILNNYKKRLAISINMKLSYKKEKLDSIKDNYYFKYPLNHIYDKRQYLDLTYDNLIKLIKQILREKNQELTNRISLLNNLNPLSIFSRGYSLVMDERGSNVKSINDVKENDILNIGLIDGSIVARAIRIIKEEKSFGKDEL